MPFFKKKHREDAPETNLFNSQDPTQLMPDVEASEAEPKITSHALERVEMSIAETREALSNAAGAGDYAKAAKLQQRLGELDAERRDAYAKARKEYAKDLRRKRKAMKGKNPLAPEDGGIDYADFVRDPEGPQRIVPFASLFRDGIMDLGDGRYSASVSFDDTNYLLAREENKEAVIVAYRDWLNSHSEGEDIQFTFASRRVDKRTFEQSYAFDADPNDPVGNEFRDELNSYISDKMTASAASMIHDRIVTFTCTASSHDEAARHLSATIKNFGNFMRRFKCSCHWLRGQDRMDLINSFTKPDDEAGKYTYSDIVDHEGLTVRDLVSPWRVFRPGDGLDDPRLVIGNRWVKSYTLLPHDGGWGSSMRDDLLSDLAQLGHDITVSVHISPWAPTRAVRAANTAYLDVASENATYKTTRSRPERGYFIDDTNMPPQMREAEEGAKETRAELTSHNQRMFSATIVLTCFGRDEKSLEDACQAVEAVFQVHSKPGLESWVALREQSYTSCLPLGLNLVPYCYNIMTEPLSALVPFMSAEFQDPNGLLLGVNADTNNLLMCSRIQRTLTNAMIVAQPGGGKSVITKLQQLQVHLTDPEADQIILDPEGEYVAGTLALGGQVVNISESSPDHVNPLDISPYYASSEPTLETNPLPAKVSFVQSLIQRMSHSITDEERNALDRACEVVYEKWLNSRDDEDMPILSDLVDYLRNDDSHRAEASHHLAELLYRFTEGTFDFFNHKTNVNLTSRLVDFSLVDMSTELKGLAMLILLDQIWVRVTKNRNEGRRTYLWVDEMQILIDDDFARHTLDIFWTRGRKWDLYNTAITQNITRIEDITETGYMLTNSPFVILMKQSPDSATLLAETFGLSEEQRDVLTSAHPGEGIAVIDSKIVHFDFEIERDLYSKIYRFITTSPDDLRADRRSAAALRATKPVHILGGDDDLDEPEPTPYELKVAENEARIKEEYDRLMAEAEALTGEEESTETVEAESKDITDKTTADTFEPNETTESEEQEATEDKTEQTEKITDSELGLEVAEQEPEQQEVEEADVEMIPDDLDEDEGFDEPSDVLTVGDSPFAPSSDTERRESVVVGANIDPTWWDSHRVAKE